MGQQLPRWSPSRGLPSTKMGIPSRLPGAAGQRAPAAQEAEAVADAEAVPEREAGAGQPAQAEERSPVDAVRAADVRNRRRPQSPAV
jgi:hypothetical protein